MLQLTSLWVPPFQSNSINYYSVCRLPLLAVPLPHPVTPRPLQDALREARGVGMAIHREKMCRGDESSKGGLQKRRTCES